MVRTTLISLFKRDLSKLKAEIAAYQNEQQLWIVEGAITNSGGNLCLHLLGNINAFIGSELGGTGYVRQRNDEFSLKNIPRADLLLQIQETIEVVDTTLGNMEDGDLAKEYPLLVFKEKMTTGYFLIHLATHLSYHLGQVNYHRRLLDRQP
tara:strand:+ start:2288 stop:2740 length:453 start_codon:yes stop_codon:yes gene_type:complete